ncbi:hypothetical protein TorRG33x02_055340 [Trema orientale]|uniref:Uncharacterized protein n=1 Tax=Trema orientale TaxID=63057 RepID=A0A2P5FLI7_TREOI|nr:hypothetical protein TorRG33x02_055340 [Trema orientale]
MNNFDEGGVNFDDERLNHILNIISHVADFRYPIANALVLLLLAVGVFQEALHPPQLCLQALHIILDGNQGRRFVNE